MECCIKYGDLFCIWQQLFCSHNSTQCRWIVQWCQRRQFVDSFDNFICDFNRRCEFIAPHNNTVTDPLDFIQVNRCLTQHKQNNVQGLVVIFHRRDFFLLCSVWVFLCHKRIFQTDFFNVSTNDCCF